MVPGSSGDAGIFERRFNLDRAEIPESRSSEPFDIIRLTEQRDIVIEDRCSRFVEMIHVQMRHDNRIRIGNRRLPSVRQLNERIWLLIGRIADRWPSALRIEHGVDQEAMSPEREDSRGVPEERVVHGQLACVAGD
jgi:hypothetical protein